MYTGIIIPSVNSSVNTSVCELPAAVGVASSINHLY